METLKTVNLLIVQTYAALHRDVANSYYRSKKAIFANMRYFESRIKSEGLAFVTKTLPSLGKSFDLALEEGNFLCPTSFKRKKGTSLPLCLTGLIERVFANDGTLLDDPDVLAIKHIRQISFMFYKLETDYQKEIVNDFISNFIKVDESLTQMDEVSLDQAAVIFNAQAIIREIFKDFDAEDIYPRPGPGAECNHKSTYERYEPSVLYDEVHQAYPYYRYFYMHPIHLSACVQRYRDLPRINSGFSRLACVPKDSRGPRLICIEPNEYMWFQQGLGRAIVEHLERHWLTKNHVNFTDQSVNGQLALKSSSTMKHATLDMKEASDRVSKALVEVLFDDVPKLRDKLLALSTKKIKLPDGNYLSIKKFAPMGSSLCFPVMSIVHFSLALACFKLHHGKGSYKALAKDLYVYGDDIICQSSDAAILYEEWPKFGLVFNQTKSYIRGRFRESCGIDAYNGVNVTPLRIKSCVVRSMDPSDIVRSIAVSNNFYLAGYWHVSALWKEWITRFHGTFPVKSRDAGHLGWISYQPNDFVHSGSYSAMKWSEKYQSWSLKVRFVKTVQHASMIGCWERYMRSLLHTSDSAPLFERRQTKLVWRRIPISSL